MESGRKVISREFRKWGGFIKFSHTVFAMPFALAAMLTAAKANHGWPGFRIFVLIVLAMVAARSSAMAFNRIADRDIDALNPRTRNRHLPAGAISLPSAWTLLIVATMVFAGACYLINPQCFLLCPVALAIVWFYSLTKRFTDFSHVYLGVALSLAPIGAWIAVKGSLDIAPVILALGVVCWLVGFDIIYSIQDYEFDRKNRLHSLPVRWGVHAALIFAFFCHMIMWIFLFAFGLLSGFKVAYSIGLAIILLTLLMEHWLARRRSTKWIQIAFFRLNGMISFIFLVCVLAEVLFPGFRQPG